MSVTAATATTPVTTFSVLLRLPPTSSVLWSITHPPDPPARVVRDQQRAVRQHQQPRRPAPARIVGQLPADDEVGDRYWQAALHMHAHYLGPRRHGAVPRAMVGHERVALVAGGEHGPRVERDAQRRRVGGERDRRRL